MLTGTDTPLSSQYHQLRIASDLAALTGVCKHVLELDDAAQAEGRRTVGQSERPELVPLDTLKELYRSEPPRETGLNTVEACEAVLTDDIQAVLQLGGNLVRAVPDTVRIEEHWRASRSR